MESIFVTEWKCMAATAESFINSLVTFLLSTIDKSNLLVIDSCS